MGVFFYNCGCLHFHSPLQNRYLGAYPGVGAYPGHYSIYFVGSIYSLYIQSANGLVSQTV